jgi:hypothetical protein
MALPKKRQGLLDAMVFSDGKQVWKVRGGEGRQPPDLQEDCWLRLQAWRVIRRNTGARKIHLFCPG